MPSARTAPEQRQASDARDGDQRQQGVPVVVPRLPSCAMAPAARARSAGSAFNCGIAQSLRPAQCPRRRQRNAAKRRRPCPRPATRAPETQWRRKTDLHHPHRRICPSVQTPRVSDTVIDDKRHEGGQNGLFGPPRIVLRHQGQEGHIGHGIADKTHAGVAIGGLRLDRHMAAATRSRRTDAACGRADRSGSSSAISTARPADTPHASVRPPEGRRNPPDRGPIKPSDGEGHRKKTGPKRHRQPLASARWPTARSAPGPTRR